MAKLSQMNKYPIFLLPLPEEEVEQNLFELEDDPSKMLKELLGHDGLEMAREAIKSFTRFELTEDQLIATILTLKGGI